jgi:hypothetical protein
VDYPVDNWHRYIVLVEELAPAGEVLVGGQDDGSVLVQAVDQLEQVVPGLSGHGQVTQFVDDQQVVLAQLFQPFFQFSFLFRQLQFFNQGQRVAEQYPVTGFHRFVANPNGQVGLADTRWPDQDQVVTLVEEAEVQQGVHLTLIPNPDSHRLPPLSDDAFGSCDLQFARPQTSDLRPQTSDLRPQTSDLRPQTSDLRPQTPTTGRAYRGGGCFS